MPATKPPTCAKNATPPPWLACEYAIVPTPWRNMEVKTLVTANSSGISPYADTNALRVYGSSENSNRNTSRLTTMMSTVTYGLLLLGCVSRIGNMQPLGRGRAGRDIGVGP